MEVEEVDRILIVRESVIHPDYRDRGIYLPYHLEIIRDIRTTHAWLKTLVGTSMHVEFFESRLGPGTYYQIPLKWVRIDEYANNIPNQYTCLSTPRQRYYSPKINTNS